MFQYASTIEEALHVSGNYAYALCRNASLGRGRVASETRCRELITNPRKAVDEPDTVALELGRSMVACFVDSSIPAAVASWEKLMMLQGPASVRTITIAQHR